MRPVAIVGAGLSGLACALHLHRRGVPVRLFEASDGVGGRVRTDRVDGFLLDRGFQVLQTAYPETRRMLDYDALDLGAFRSGALVPDGRRQVLLGDPFRNPLELFGAIRAPVGSFADKLRVARLRRSLRKGRHRRLLQRDECSTLERLQALGFSDEFIRRFFVPFFGGVFLEGDLETSSRWFELLFRLFSEGEATLPAGGMQAIPEQLASQLPSDVLHLEAPVTAVHSRSVELRDGDTVLCSAAVVACSEPAAVELLGEAVPAPRTQRSVHCLYYDAEQSPLPSAHLLLGAPGGLINSLCVPSLVAPSYAPEGRHLISVTVLAERAKVASDLDAACRAEMAYWFGPVVEEWRLLDQQVIDGALPSQRPGELLQRASTSVSPGIYRCGDYLETSSIHGALVSGRKTAERIRREVE